MKKLILIMMLIFSSALYAPTLKAQVSGSQTNSADNAGESKLNTDDAKAFRKLLADKLALEAECKELTRKCDEYKESAAGWKSLYEKEKYRADVVKTAEIENLSKAYAKLQKSNYFLKTQSVEDKNYISKVESKNRALKTYLIFTNLASFGGGFAAGYYVGNQNQNQNSPPILGFRF